MNPNDIETVVTVIFDELKERKGFDDWWDTIGAENAEDIARCAEARVVKALGLEEKHVAELGTARDKQWLQDCAELVKAKMPDNYSFVVFGFPNSGADRAYYASNATRESAIAALKQWIAQKEADFGKHVVAFQPCSECNGNGYYVDRTFGQLPMNRMCGECKGTGVNDLTL